ncbi:type III polyketide synthase [Vibrio mimicus]
MPTLCLPESLYPINVVTNEDIVNFINLHHPDIRHKDRAFEMIHNTTIEKRHTIIPFDEIMKLDNFGQRGELYEKHSKMLAIKAAVKALSNAELQPEEISMVIVTSCTGFMMPSLTAYLINQLNLRDNTIQLPISQMGCVGGAFAINRAYEHCLQSKKNNVLIVSVETSSLCFHRQADRLQDFISDALFGDGVASVVMRGDDNLSGFKILAKHGFMIKDTESYIKYGITDQGFHFSLDKEVMYSVELAAPEMEKFIVQELGGLDQIDFYISHTGGRRILDEVQRCLQLPPSHLHHSRECLRLTGNTSSVAVLDVLSRHFAERKLGDRGVISAFGPGFTTELAIGVWV